RFSALSSLLPAPISIIFQKTSHPLRWQSCGPHNHLPPFVSFRSEGLVIPWEIRINFGALRKHFIPERLRQQWLPKANLKAIRIRHSKISHAILLIRWSALESRPPNLQVFNQEIHAINKDEGTGWPILWDQMDLHPIALHDHPVVRTVGHYWPDGAAESVAVVGSSSSNVCNWKDRCNRTPLDRCSTFIQGESPVRELGCSRFLLYRLF